MQQPTIDAPHSAKRTSLSLLLSVSLHVVLLSMMIGGKSKEPELRTPARAQGEHLEYALVMSSTGSAPVVKQRHGLPSIPKPEMPSVIPLPVPTDLSVPMPYIPDAPTPQFVDTLFPGVVSGDGATHVMPAGAVTSQSAGGEVVSEISGSAYDFDAVALPENPKPAYPPGMLRRSIEADFPVEFVVDTTGKVDESTIRIPPTVPQEFADAVMHVLVRWHFRPALQHGIVVPRVVRQPFVFTIVRPST
jgi:TonB family protein